MESGDRVEKGTWGGVGARSGDLEWGRGERGEVGREQGRGDGVWGQGMGTGQREEWPPLS